MDGDFFSKVIPYIKRTKGLGFSRDNIGINKKEQ
jgi:hypothetical protein